MSSCWLDARGCCLLLVLLFSSIAATAQVASASPGAKASPEKSRPNILWITSEDNAAHWLGCYGNRDALTPRLDALAIDSVLFSRAYSNAPVCAVARSTLLHGVYAVTLGTQHMRSRQPIPAAVKPYVSYLRELGYYCTNNSKTDYNRQGDDASIWDASHRQAHYKHRQAGQPFFAIFNLTVSHESSLFPQKVAANRQRGIIPRKTRLSVNQLQLPPYLPDLPAVRSDFAIYHDTMTALDTQVSILLKELAQLGLADDTVVFYYADHGGPTPRGKRYLTDTGVHVPMLVHVPEKWQHLSPFEPGERVDELVSFVDLAPTLLSLCGQQQPSQMQGRAFLGSQRVEPPEQPIVFLYADRFDEIEGLRRGLSDGRFKYIRRFTPHLPAAPCSHYSLSMPSWIAWQQAWHEKRLPAAYQSIWEAPQPVEELYDLQADPWEIRNLAHDPKHSVRLVRYRNRLRDKMAEVKDTGVIPESMFRALAGEKTILEYAGSEHFNFEHALQSAFVASAGDPANVGALAAMLSNVDPVVRYWGTLGSAILGDAAVELGPQLEALLTDSVASVRMTASLALARVGRLEAGKAALFKEFDSPLNPEQGVQLLNLVATLDCEAEVPESWIEKTLDNVQANEYLRRFAQRLYQERQP